MSGFHPPMDDGGNFARYVPMDLYLADRKDRKDWESRVDNKLDGILDAAAVSRGGQLKMGRIAAAAGVAGGIIVGAIGLLVNSGVI